MVAHELYSGRKFRIFQDQFGAAPPYVTGPDVLFVAYYASAELGCYRVLSWPMPQRILDLFTEFRDRTNGLPTLAGSGLLGALAYFNLDGIGATEKHELQQAIGNGSWHGRYTARARPDKPGPDVRLGRSRIQSRPGRFRGSPAPWHHAKPRRSPDDRDW